MDTLIRAARAYWRWNQRAASTLADNLDAAAVAAVLLITLTLTAAMALWGR